jgi:hypothetical protein
MCATQTTIACGLLPNERPPAEPGEAHLIDEGLAIAFGHLLCAERSERFARSMAKTVRILHCCSQAAIAFSSAVVHPKRRTGWLSRLGGTAT